MRNGWAKIFLLAALLPVTSGCVSKAVHEGLRQQYEQLAAEKKVAEVDCEQSSMGLTQQLAELDGKMVLLAEQVKVLDSAAEALKREKETLVARGKADEDLRQQMVARLQEELDHSEARIEQIKDTLKIKVVEKLMFKSGSVQISSRGAAVLAKIAPILAAATDKEILVVGHADDLPPSANLAQLYPSNWELSAARAAAIVHVLVWGHRLPPERMMIEGAAHYRPLAAFGKKPDEYRRGNRVVEIILKPRE